MDKAVEDLEWNFKFNRPWKHLGIDPYNGMSKAEKDEMFQKVLDGMSSMANEATRLLMDIRVEGDLQRLRARTAIDNWRQFFQAQKSVDSGGGR